ncbi:MAG: hypothetical protein Q7J69_03740 [Candidatus Omnitrophota bacterium]|nr:hypothetical protein [Candidatus Omnitrophota bacterium]
MRSSWLVLSLLAGVLIFGTAAAPTAGVREADRLQREADVARSGGQWDIAAPRYMKLAELFPETPHGRAGASRAREMRAWAREPDRSPASEDPVSWIHEIADFFTWP